MAQEAMTKIALEERRAKARALDMEISSRLIATLKPRLEGLTVTEDVDVVNGGQSMSYSKEGQRVTRTFFVNGLTMTPGSGYGEGTLYLAQKASEIPQRGDPHPYLDGTGGKPLLCADTIESVAMSTSQAKITIGYAYLNPVTWEATNEHDMQPGLLTVASSLQSWERITDIAGNPLSVPYLNSAKAAGNLNIIPPSGPALSTPATANAKVKSQIPNIVLRFQRRETKQCNGAGLVGYYNGSSWTISQLNNSSFPSYTLLCTRVENTTQDFGRSWIVTYEFQFMPPQALSGTVNYISPAAESSYGPISGGASGWDVGCYFVLPNGYKTTQGSDPSVNIVGPGMIPGDAIPSVYAVYGKDNGAFAALGIS